MTQHWVNEWRTENSYDLCTDVRWSVAIDIIRHCALVSAKDAGEDSAGRTSIKLMPAEEVAERALEIADQMVEKAEARGWFKLPTVTPEQRAQYAGLLEKLKLYGSLGEGAAASERLSRVIRDLQALKETPA